MRWLAIVYRKLIIPRTRVISVVGSLGKTTTTQVLRQVMLKNLRKEAYGNVRSSLAENILRVWPWDKYSVIETAIGELGLMASYPPMLRQDITVVTAIKSDHLLSFRTLEVTRKEKSIMVKTLKPNGLAVLNGDDPHVRWMATQTKARVVFFGLGVDNDIRASEVRIEWPGGMRFKISANGQEREVLVNLLGEHMVYSVLAAVAVGLNEGMTLDEVINKLEKVKAVTGRMEVIPLDNGAVLIDDCYKGGMESYQEAVGTLAKIPAKRRIMVMGKAEYAGESSGKTIRRIGEWVAGCADIVLFCGDTFKQFKSGAVNNGLDGSKIIYASSRIGPAIEWLKANIREGDVVLIKSNGSRRFQRIALSLQGKKVGCRLKECHIKVVYCDNCPLLNFTGEIYNNECIRKDVKI